MKLTLDRIWWLKGFADDGWTMGRPFLVGIKKWDSHSTALVRMGMLEADSEAPNMYRITEAGRSALAAPGKTQEGETPVDNGDSEGKS